jgi:hypothetical protein
VTNKTLRTTRTFGGSFESTGANIVRRERENIVEDAIVGKKATWRFRVIPKETPNGLAGGFSENAGADVSQMAVGSEGTVVSRFQ